MEVVLDQDQFLRDESLPVKVRLANLSGQTLHLGQEEDWLTFSVESREGFIIRRLAQPQVAGEFDVESSQAATRQVDLMPCFDLSRPGRYTVTATVRVKQWNQELLTKPKTFDIITGTKLWEREFGVPWADPELYRDRVHWVDLRTGGTSLPTGSPQPHGNPAPR